MWVDKIEENFVLGELGTVGGEDALAEVFGEFFFEGVELEVALHQGAERVASRVRQSMLSRA